MRLFADAVFVCGSNRPPLLLALSPWIRVSQRENPAALHDGIHHPDFLPSFKGGIHGQDKTQESKNPRDVKQQQTGVSTIVQII